MSGQWFTPGFYTKTLLLCFAGLFSLGSFALTPAQGLVEKMSESARKLSYKGYFSYDWGSRSSSYFLVHLADGKADRHRLVFLDGEPLEIISDGHGFRYIHQGDRNVHVEPVVDPGLLLDRNNAGAAAWQNYQAEITGEGRVAGRPVQRVKLTPNDEHRYPLVFFIDKETGLMLKMLVLDAKGQLLERFRYVMIDYGRVTAEDLKPGIPDYIEVDHTGTNDAVAGKVQLPAWQLTWIPPGFQQEKTRMKEWSQPAHEHERFMYSDGLTVFSVFIEPTDFPEKTVTSRKIGSTSAVTHYVSLNGKLFLVTVVGEIPLLTARQIAMSIRPAS